ncbi:MAG TPA: alpha/beta fold hydrolase [Micromonosporaceae bacterium]
MASPRTLLAPALVTVALFAGSAVPTTAALLVGSAAPAAAATGTTGFRTVDITAADGVVLEANVIEPATVGLHPAVVFVNSWGLNDAEYLAQASALAQGGYTVLSYTTRGFWGSGGRIDTAGPKDIADVSTVLDWVTTHTSADPARLGLAGISYGAGISLIAAGHDARVKAVVAMSGWTDLVASLYGGDTRRPQAVWLLAALAELTGRPSAELTQVVSDYFADTDIDEVKAFGRIRSASTYLDSINANHPAILMANAYGDSLFPPNQLVDFFNRLTGPKRLEFAPGDHAVVESTGLVGLPNHVWTSTRRWLDQYLSGIDTGIASEPPVVLRVRETGAVEQYPTWASVNTGVTRYGLGAARWWDGTGPMTAGSTPTGWSQTIWCGTDTTADAGVTLLSNGLEALTGVPPAVWLPSVNRINGAVWTSEPLPYGTRVRGIPVVHLSVQPATGTLVSYLYDVDATLTGHLIAQAPVTWTGSPGSVTVPLPATAYDVPAGHRLALVVDTQDPQYLDANTWGAALTMTATSWLDLPVR